MLPSYWEDLGVVVVVSLFVTAVALVVRRKWRMASARKEEVRRLVAMASKEAARAEIEYAFGYGFEKGLVGASVGGGGEDGAVRLCAVCYSPTTTRCSRCKVVRYCSGKCQIIHWRQGHKDKCRPPEIQHDPSGACSDLKTASAAESKLTGDVSENLVTKSTERHLGVHTPSDTISSSSVFQKKDDAEISNLVDKPGTERNSGPSSGCTTFASVSESVGAAPESDQCLPGNTIKPDHFSSDIASSSSKNIVEFREVLRTNSSLPEIAIAAIPVNTVSCLDKLNHQKAGCSTEELECRPDVDSRMSGFGDSTNVSRSLHQDMTCESVLNQHSGNGDLSTSKSSKKDIGTCLDPKVSFHFSFDMPNDAVSSQSSSGSRMRSNWDVASKTISYSRPKDPYFGASASVVSGENNSESLPNHRRSKSQANAVSEVYTCGDGGNVVSDSTPLNTFSSPTIESTRNTITASNGGHALKSVRKVVQQLKPSKPSKSYKILPTYDLYIKLYSEKVDLQPCGLINCGNSCYANAVLQCLVFTRPLTAYLLRGLHSKTCPKKEWCFTCEFENLVVRMKQGKAPLSPIGILSHIHNLGSNLGHGKEEDAHEFLRYAIDAMQSTCLRETRNPAGPLSDETTLMQLIFGGYFRSKIRCMKCHSTSERCERMMDLTVEIHGDIKTLEEALTRFTATEILDGENKYKCNRCKSYEKAKKKLSVLEAPNVLTIALKRFQSGKFGKLNKTVQFPEILNMSNYMCSGSCDKTPVYCLYAVIVHVDIMNAAFSGHYVCYVKNTQNKWYKIDDSMVKPVERDRVLSKGAYMLLYARISPRAPSLVRNEIPCGSARSKSRKLQESVPSGNVSENGVLKTRSNCDCIVDNVACSDCLDSHVGRFIPPYRGHMVDSSSDSSSLLSCSDEGSCSTESTRDSTSTDDFSDYLFGESGGFTWNSPSRVSEDSDGFVAYSPPSLRHLSEGISNGHIPYFLSDGNSAWDLSSLDGEDAYQRRGGVSYASASGLDRVGMWQHQDSRRVFTRGKESSPFLPSDTTKHCRNLTEQCSRRETNWDKPKSGLFMRSTRDKSSQTRQ